MKKLIAKTFASVMAVLMICTSVQITAFAAADTLTLEENKLTAASYYSNICYLGDDFIASLFEGVSKDKTITVTKGDTVTLTYGAAQASSVNYGSTDFTTATTGLYYYGASDSYCFATDTAFSFTGTKSDDANTTVTATVSGFGASSTGNGNYGAYQSNTAIQTTFTIDTTNVAAGSYNMSLTFKYQMKKKKGTSWSTKKEYSGTTTGFVLTVVEAEEEDTTTQGMGGSIRVGDNAGLRFGFKTTASTDEVSEYGFVYSTSVSDEATLVKDSADSAVKTVTATNYIDHGDYTTFNLVFTGIKSEYYSSSIYARSYVVTTDGTVHYSEVLTRNFTDVANSVINDSDVDDDTKTAVQNMLNGTSTDA